MSVSVTVNGFRHAKFCQTVTQSAQCSIVTQLQDPSVSTQFLIWLFRFDFGLRLLGFRFSSLVCLPGGDCTLLLLAWQMYNFLPLTATHEPIHTCHNGPRDNTTTKTQTKPQPGLTTTDVIWWQQFNLTNETNDKDDEWKLYVYIYMIRGNLTTWKLSLPHFRLKIRKYIFQGTQANCCCVWTCFGSQSKDS